MPLTRSAQGLRVADARTDVCAVWSMNFAAGCQDATAAFVGTGAEYDGLEKELKVHPLFLAACVEVMLAFASVYKAGLTKEELVRHTLLHHFTDIEFVASPFAKGATVRKSVLRPDETILTETTLAYVSEKRSGVHTGTAFVHKDEMGHVLAKGYFGGVLDRLKCVDSKAAEHKEYIPTRIHVDFKSRLASDITTICLKIPNTAAHIWDSCIRNPYVPRAKSSAINVHTNIFLAKKAGLPHRTMNGLGVLGIAVSQIIKVCLLGQPELIRRIACTFSNPLYLDQSQETVLVYLDVVRVDENTIWFQVKNAKGKLVLSNGAMLLFPQPRSSM